MAGPPASRRRPFNTRPRHSSGSRNKVAVMEVEERPPKRRRYIPGGPGGGGRWQAADGSEELVGGTGPGGYAYTGPRGRVGRENAANGVITPARPVRAAAVASERSERPRREYSRRDRTSTRPRYSSAAAAAAAVVQGDGFKPREERGWEEFHQDLDIDARLPLFTADEVDGIVHTPVAETPGMDLKDGAEDMPNGAASPVTTPGPRRRGRPRRGGDSLLKGIGSPHTPKVIPLPGPNPRERLTLPKPSFKRVDPFARYEDAAGQLNYVDRSMASVGYQESDVFLWPDKKLIRLEEGTIEEELDLGPLVKSDGEVNAAIGSSGVGRVEYDMDEQDLKWLEDYNAQRKVEQVEPIKPAIFEITMTKIEKEWHALEKRIPKPNPKPPQTHRPRSSSAAAVNGEPQPGEEQDSKCAICDDGDCENTNAIVFCDGCDLAVHQECYGVPYIPEGQWMCRRCQQIGRGTPTCIFCPNTDGAFKQTVSSRWAHLLCSIWIPEVSLGNSTFMEPVMDVEKVPRQRWKLQCYICRQRMGACIQCGNKNCFEAFHVTCARRAKLFLQMKSTQGGISQMLDSSVLKAFCHRHVPSEWRKQHDTNSAVEWAMEYYRYAMRGRQWADSQQAALNMASLQSSDTIVQSIETPAHKAHALSSGSQKRKKTDIGKNNGRLNSGAPLIPQIVYDSVEASLQRFTVRKRREFAADMCRYWTLKRESKRGAALIKRLQLQMESFSSMDVTRRDFAAMGAVGRPRLQRRIEFADSRLVDVAQLAEITDLIKQREEKRLEDTENLRSLLNSIYFPIPPLLLPIIDKAQQLDPRGAFRHGLQRIRERVDERFYTSVPTFSADLSIAFSTVIGMSTVSDTAEVHAVLSDDKGRKDLSADQKEKRKLAKRIIKAIQPALEDATLKESQLAGTKWEEKLQDLGALFEPTIASRRDSISSEADDENEAEMKKEASINGAPTNDDVMQVDQPEIVENGTVNVKNEEGAEKKEIDVIGDSGRGQGSTHPPTPDDSGADTAEDNRLPPTSTPADQQGTVAPTSSAGQAAGQGPPTPPLSATADLHPPLSHGGLPWYMEPFDPVGTTIHEERWTGRRAMSEELSDMDEGEFADMEDGDVDMEISGTATPAGGEEIAAEDATASTAARRKARAKRSRRFR